MDGFLTVIKDQFQFVQKGVYYMKIEKISDNQIRCTLNKSDLIDRELRISELAYGTEKAKALFRDMIQQAFYEFGFEVDDIPLMIEAIPVSTECLILVITKVEDPDELDTRFSKFSSFNVHDNSDNSDSDDDAYADEIISSFDDDLSEDSEEGSKDLIETQEIADTGMSEKSGAHSPSNLTKIYSFRSLREVTELAYILVGTYNGSNTLYKNPVTATYYLVISISEHTPEEFNKICNIISEFGKPERSTYASSTYYKEHYEIIVNHHALQILSVM
jgi:adapter protein MecA 1/2